MIEALHISESGLRATQAWLGNISNNIANMHTSAYKSSVVSFSNLVSTNDEYKENLSFMTQSGLGTRITSPTFDFTVGSFKQTERELDFSINGEGFFEVVLDSGEFAYTRLGNFQVNNDGYLTTEGGLLLSERIQIPQEVNEINLTENGELIGLFSDSGDEISLGTLKLADIVNTNSLESVGDSLYKLANESEGITLQIPGENGSGKLLQGFLEMSNVSLIDEMTNLVLAQRAYQLNARLIQTSDQILETINNMRR